MAKRKLTEQEMNYEFARTSLTWRNVSKILVSVIRYVAICFCVYCFFDALKEFSGKETHANVLMEIILGIKANQWIGYIFGGGGLIYAGVRNRQLKNTRKAHADHIKGLEKRIDPERQESRLNKYGETHEDDR